MALTEKQKEYKRRYRSKFPERHREQCRADAARRREKVRSNPELRMQNLIRAAAWDAAHPMRVKIRKQNWFKLQQRDPQFWAAMIFKKIRARCKRNGTPFDLAVEDLRALLPSDGRCPVLGTKLSFGEKLGRDSPSVDRVIPALGYVRGNVVIISFKANSMKRDCTDPQELRQLADFLETCLMRVRDGNKRLQHI